MKTCPKCNGKGYTCRAAICRNTANDEHRVPLMGSVNGMGFCPNLRICPDCIG